MSENQQKVKTYRFKFTNEFLECLKDFSRIHRFDDSNSLRCSVAFNNSISLRSLAVFDSIDGVCCLTIECDDKLE